MNLLKLSILVLIDKYNKVTEVANKLNMKQPTITFHMKSLEEEMGVELFKSRSGRVVLTDAGKALHSYAVKMTQLAEDARRTMQEFSSHSKGTLTVGADQLAGSSLLPDILSSFSKLYPGINIQVVIQPTVQIKQRLVEQQVDIAFYHEYHAAPSMTGYDQIVLQQDHMLMAFSPVHPYAKQSAADLSEVLIPSSLIQHGKDSFVYDYSKKWMQQRSLNLWEFIQVDSEAVVKQMLFTGEHCALFPDTAIREELEAGTLQAIPAGSRDPDELSFQIISSCPAEPASALTKEFIHYVKNR